jgi:hypothetical protein
MFGPVEKGCRRWNLNFFVVLAHEKCARVQLSFKTSYREPTIDECDDIAQVEKRNDVEVNFS